LFVLEGDQAVKKEVVLGIVGDEYSEILSGLKEGDKVILEDSGSNRRNDETGNNN
jgi:HlyD family secretion protein